MRSSLVAILSVFHLLVALARPAWAEPVSSDAWGVTFGGGGADTLRLAHERKILVAAAGQTTTALAQAASALCEGLRRIEGVRCDEVKADLTKADDASIALSSRAQGDADAVFVVRLFPAAVPTAVISIYGQDGALKRAYSAKEGVALVGPDNASGDGVSARQIARVNEATKQTDRPVVVENREGFERSVIEVREASVSADGKPVTTEAGFYLRNERLKSSVELYKAIGRPDLARDYEANISSKRGLTTGGYVVAGLGTLLLLAGALSDSTDEFGDPEPNTGLVATGAVTMAVGFFMALAGHGKPLEPVTDQRRRELVDEYNRGLRRKYGLPAEASAPPGLRLEVRSHPGGAGLGLGASF